MEKLTPEEVAERILPIDGFPGFTGAFADAQRRIIAGIQRDVDRLQVENEELKRLLDIANANCMEWQAGTVSDQNKIGELQEEIHRLKKRPPPNGGMKLIQVNETFAPRDPDTEEFIELDD